MPVQLGACPPPAESAWAEDSLAIPAAAKDYSITLKTSSEKYTGSDIEFEVTVTNTAGKKPGFDRDVYLVDSNGEIVEGSNVRLTGGDWSWKQQGDGKYAATAKVKVKEIGEYKVMLNKSDNLSTTTSEAEDATISVVANDSQAEANKAWKNAKVEVSATADADGEYILPYTGSSVDFKVLSIVEDVNGKTLGIDDYEVVYSGTNSSTAPTAVGTYTMTIMPSAKLKAEMPAYANVTEGIVYTFQIAQASLSGAQLYQVDADAADNGISDTTFTFNGTDLFADGAYGVVLDGKDITDYVTVTTSATPSNPTGAGEYTVTIEGKKGSAYADLTYSYKMSVEQFDLEGATVVIDDMAGADGTNTAPTNANITVKNGSDELKLGTLDYDGITSGATGWNAGKTTDGNVDFAIENLDPAKGGSVSGAVSDFAKLGEYTISLTGVGYNAYKGVYEGNVKGSIDATMNRVQAAATFNYAGKAFTDQSFDASKGQAFSLDKISVLNGSDELDSDEYTVTVTKDGKEVTSFTEPGTYTVVAQVNVAKGGKYELGGKGTFDFTVTNGEVTPNATSISVGGKLVVNNKVAVDYTGSAIAPKATIKLVDEDGNVIKTLVEDEDYTFAIEKQQNGKFVEVDSILGQGSYRVTIESDSYDLSAVKGPIDVKVNAVSATNLEVSQSKYYNADGSYRYGILYTGEAADVAITATVGSKDDVAVDPSEYTATFKKVAKEDEKNVVFANDEYDYTGVSKFETVLTEDVLEPGYYQVTVSSVANANVTFASETLTFRILDKVSFADVPADAWFAGVVSEANRLQYMKGIDGTQLFMPNADITRAEVAQVFFNMAGGKDDTSDAQYPTKFTDVAGSDWFAQAVSWASTVGIVGGYDGTTLFGSYDNATREQIATMIYRYAKAQGMDVTVEDETAALAKYSDGASVSEYAKTAMAWCVEQGIFGVDVDALRPGDFMCRAEMAATSVRVQPDGIKF